MQPITKASTAMPVTTTKPAAHIMAGSDPRLEENANAKLARKRAEAQRASAALHDAPDTTTPLIGRAPLETLPDPPLFDDPPPPEMPRIEIRTTIEHRGRSFVVVANGLTLDQFCDILDRRHYTAAAQTQEWQTLPDGTPICPKHHTPMRKRERQGDTWWSHNVAADGDAPVYCKGYVGKDSPGYDR
jgi:hypothetical protein